MALVSEPAPARHALTWREVSGPLLTVVAIALVESLRATPLHFPGPNVALLLCVAWSTFVGGLVPGLVSCVLSLAYGGWFFFSPPQAIDPLHGRRFADLAIGAPLLAAMMAVLRNRAQRAQRQAADSAVARQYGLLFEEAGEPMLLSDASHRYVFVNRRACELSGYAREELLRMRVGDLLPRVSRADRAAGHERPHGESRVEREMVRRDGATLHVEVSARRLADGTSLSILRDVSEEHATIARLEQSLARMRARAEELEGVSELAASVGHDFNNMLTTILGETDLLLARQDLGPDARAQLENLKVAALQCAELTARLLEPLGRRAPEAEVLRPRLAGHGGSA